MNKIWNQRLSQYQQKLLKYLRYVFNDHFVIAMATSILLIITFIH